MKRKRKKKLKDSERREYQYVKNGVLTVDFIWVHNGPFSSWLWLCRIMCKFIELLSLSALLLLFALSGFLLLSSLLPFARCGCMKRLKSYSIWLWNWSHFILMSNRPVMPEIIHYMTMRLKPVYIDRQMNIKEWHTQTRARIILLEFNSIIIIIVTIISNIVVTVVIIVINLLWGWK